MEKLIAKSQMIMLPGGFSGGDEPDGSGKFIATTFRNPRIAEQVNNLLKNRDGLMLGICNGFQALIKLGLVPYGEIRELKANIFHIWLIQELLPLSHRGLQMSTQAMCLLFPCHTVRADFWLMLKL
jgi:phosphoribosylformylglycinamidine (FGAM) synthase-like amidotransferase family enzyme